ncbi:MAG: tripartite tricarboxylate transporter substrate binding protein [Burkholderiales bacterium]|nr:tripartite tricarboxylate transporter substrate binding protein [Burkholderiales bacterium]
MVHAQTYPSRPLVFVVPYQAGGGVDLTGRIIGAQLSQQLGRAVVIENRPGANGTIGADYVAKAAPDGYTLLVGGTGPLSLAPAVYKKLPYSPLKDLTPVILLVTIPQILVVHPSLPVHTVRDLIALARKHPGKLNVAAGGISQQLAGAMLASMSGVQITSVPYKGTAPAMNDLLGGHVELYFGDPSMLPTIKAGRLRALAVTTPMRYPALPGVPTVAETLPGFNITSFYGLAVPSETPREIILRLNAEAEKALADRDTREKLEHSGLIPTGGSPEVFAEFLRNHVATTAKLVREAKISVN